MPAQQFMPLLRQLADSGETDAARELALAILRREPNDPVLVDFLASILYRQNAFAEALSYTERLMRLGRADDAVLLNYSKCLHCLNRTPEAIAIAEKLFERSPDVQDIRLHLALYHHGAGHFDESLALFQTLPLTCESVPAYLGWHELRKGNFLRGMELSHYEKGKWGTESAYALPRQKRLTAESPIAGKRVLLASEGGIGDHILFVRFAQVLAARGATVIAGVPRGLVSTVSRASGVARADVMERIRPDDYDYYAPIMELAGILKLESPSAGISFPYLSSTRDKRDAWKPLLDEVAEGRPKIALRWQGEPTFEHLQSRSVPLRKLLRFGECGALFSLQRDQGLAEMQKNDPVYDLGSELVDWEDTLGILDQMEYVVTSCNVIVHMAAALGRTVILLAPLVPYFPWAKPGQSTDWYPNVHIFRQTTYGDWDTPIDEARTWMREDLRRRTAQK